VLVCLSTLVVQTSTTRHGPCFEIAQPRRAELPCRDNENARPALAWVSSPLVGRLHDVQTPQVHGLADLRALAKMHPNVGRIALYSGAAPLVRRVALNGMAAGAEGMDLALNPGLMDSTRPRGDRLEDAMQRRISHFLRIPPPNLNEKLVNTTGRISPAGLARQEMREEERGLCKIRRYNPDMLRPTTMAGYLDASRRLAQVVAAVSVLAFALLRTETSAGDAAKVQADAVKVRETLTNMGATFVKVGQVLANRPDIIRADYMEELTKLQDQVPPFPSKVAFEMMEAGLGCPPSKVFDDITPEPLAAASLGQVYKAKLKKNGKEVAIKVQRPGVAELIKRDVYLLRLIAKGFNEESVKRIGVDAVTLLDEFAVRGLPMSQVSQLVLVLFRTP